jgi:threonine synthase
MEAIEGGSLPEDEFQVIDQLREISGVEIPRAVEEIRFAPIRHTRTCRIDDMKRTVAEILGL